MYMKFEPKHHENDDLWYAINNNEISVELEDIEDIVAEVPGENDEYAWWWILKIKNKGYMLFSGSCDYTGWDCQSGVEEHGIYKTPLEASQKAPEKEEYTKRNIRKWLAEQVDGKRPFGLWEETK